MKKWALVLTMLLSGFCLASTEIKDNELAMEGYNFLRALNVEGLSYNEQQRYKKGIERYKELVQRLNFEPFPGKAEFAFDRDDTCNEYRLIILKEDASEKALDECKKELSEGFKCRLFESKIITNVVGKCVATATAHRVQIL